MGLQAGLRCGICNEQHNWLPISRDEAKQLADRDVPERVQTYLDNIVDKGFYD